MREVSQFVVVFPQRFMSADPSERDLLLNALGREYPHYSFEAYPGQGKPEHFLIIPVVGKVGDEGGDADEVQMCKPLDPRVIPDLIRTLEAYDALSSSVH